MANLNDHQSRFRKGLSNPFSSANPFSVAREEFCPTCQTDVDVDTRSHHQGTTYAWKRSCRRCGGVLARGVFDNVPVIAGGTLPPAALAWSLEGGEDRR